MAWLLTGGAGYIGAHVGRALVSEGFEVVVLDDLSTGQAHRVPRDVPLVRASVTDTDAVRTALSEHRITGVVHLAAKKAVEESVRMPLHYYEENVGGLRSLLQAMQDTGVDRMVFSSSAAVYGMPESGTVREDSPTRPLSPYGESKLVGEWLVRDVAAATGLTWVALRYFNVAGAGSPDLGDVGVSNLIPLTFQALREGRRPQVFGGDYPTRDGSCVRDYIHVADLAEAHVAAARWLEQLPAGQGTGDVFNVGRGEGVTVKEVLEVARRITRHDFAYDVVARRPGDPAQVVAAAEKISDPLRWRAQRGLEDMISSAWEAWNS